jgi:uncharacterized protein YndB with AHSA1/START domain
MSPVISPAPIRKNVRVKVSPGRAFEIFTARAGSWWLKTHSISATKSPIKDVVIEPRRGGRWFERGEDGSEYDWGKVLAWEPPARLLLAWQIDAHFHFDPAVETEVEIRFTAEGNGTLVELEHRHLERLGDTTEGLRGPFERGWTALLDSFAATAA